MYCYQPLVLIFQFFKIFEQRTSAPSKFDSWSRPCKHAIHGEKLTCMHLRFGMKLSQWPFLGSQIALIIKWHVRHV